MVNQTILENVLKNYKIIETCELTHKEHGAGLAYVLDRNRRGNTISAADYSALERAGAYVSSRVYRYAPEIVERFIFIPFAVCNEFLWWCL